MTSIWRRLRAVVLESDDWGLCAWSPDEEAHRLLADTPAFRSRAGLAYGRSTLESAGDVRRLAETLLEFRGDDGLPPVWQANTVVAAPDYARLVSPHYHAVVLPVVPLPGTPPRWRREGMWEEVLRVCREGLWWPELHGLHHVPERAWLAALRRGDADARRAFALETPVCAAVEQSGEFGPAEPDEVRWEALRRAIAIFIALFGRGPTSFCPPDYRWDDRLEDEAERLGLTLWQGRSERARRSWVTARRLLRRWTWRAGRGVRYYMPPRIVFEPRGGHGPAGSLARAVATAHRRVREAWSQGRPAVVSTHRLNYAHLDAAWSERGRAALRDLLGRLAADGAVFLVDLEVRQLHERGWSMRPHGPRTTLVRYHGEPRHPIRIPAPMGARGVRLRADRGAEGASVAQEGAAAIAQLPRGDYLLEWGGG
ncbi:MAG TPA: hypothetical protein VI792_00265 [Candidatus Eisenbacteria bacterium]